MASGDDSKTLVGVFASHDSASKTNELGRLFERLYDKDREKPATSRLLDKFHYVFTGGTFFRLLLGIDNVPRTGLNVNRLRDDVGDFLLKHSTCLPDRKDGGITIMANMVVQRQCSILWPFYSPTTVHWLGPENLALMRLCDVWNAKRLMNTASVESWFAHEAERDIKRDRERLPLRVVYGPAERRTKGRSQKRWKEAKLRKSPEGGKTYRAIAIPKRPGGRNDADWCHDLGKKTIALIAHDDMKSRIASFAIQYEHELAEFGRILATGATAQLVKGACNRLGDKVTPVLPGPSGGDIEIATAVLFNECHAVIFFIDPLNPHPHIEDIRSVFSACMAEIENNDVRMLTNEVQAREWIEEVVRRR